MKPTQVMIVEDEALLGMVIQDNLVNYGYDVIGISSSGESAIENATKIRPEVILMDIQLNGKMDGIETAKQIRKFLDIPIIYLTAYSDDKTLTKALETSPSGYLLKPFVPRELHTSIQTALHKNATNKNEKVNRIQYIQRNILKRKNLESRLYRNNLEVLIGDLLISQEISVSQPFLYPFIEFAAILEYQKEEIIRMGNLIILLLVHPEDLQIIEDYYKKILSEPGQVAEIEFRLKHKTGVWRWFSSKGIYFASKYEKGTILHHAKDITWAKNLLYTSHISTEKIRGLSNNPYFGIAILDTEAKIMNLNPTLEHLTGYTKEDLNLLNFSDYIGLKELRGICQNFEKIKAGEIDTFQAEVFLYTKHRGAFWGYMVFNAIYNPERVIDRIVCTLVDISESKLFEKKG